jgi:hypothetical protein
MKRIFTALVAVLLLLVAMPRPAWAKSPTAKITISGGALTSAIEVTDPRILDISNVWYGQFLDRSRSLSEIRFRERRINNLQTRANSQVVDST